MQYWYKKKSANALTKKGVSTEELRDLLQNDVINIWNKLYMPSIRWDRCHDISWAGNRELFEFIAFNKQVTKFDHIIRVKVDCCPVYIHCVMKVLTEILLIIIKLLLEGVGGSLPF